MEFAPILSERPGNHDAALPLTREALHPRGHPREQGSAAAKTADCIGPRTVDRGPDRLKHDFARDPRRRDTALPGEWVDLEAVPFGAMPAREALTERLGKPTRRLVPAREVVEARCDRGDKTGVGWPCLSNKGVAVVEQDALSIAPEDKRPRNRRRQTQRHLGRAADLAGETAGDPAPVRRGGRAAIAARDRERGFRHASLPRS